MALLTDGNPNDTEALRVYETAILGVANVEMIDLDAKLKLATDEISEKVLDILMGRTPSIDPNSTFRRRTGVSDVVVTSQMKRWHALHTLEVVYRDAFNNQLNDRYQAKFEEYRDLSRNACELTTRFGIGLVGNPIPRAVSPSFSVVAGFTPATVYYVQVSWVSATAQEGSPSDITTFQTLEGSLLVVQAVNPPTTAAGWNFYAGLSPSTVALQNVAPIGIGQSFTLPATGLVTGRAPGDGQLPETFVTGGRILGRG